MPGRRILVPLSDLHCGYRFGLMRTGIELPPLDEEEDSHPTESTAFQRRIWAHFLEDLDFVRDLAGNDEIVPLFVGDVTQGSALPRQALVSYRASDQQFILHDAIQPYFNLPNVKRTRIVYGTGVHVGGYGSNELALASYLEDKFGVDVGARFHFKIDLDGILLDMAHHGPATGKRIWIRGDEIRRYTRDIMMRNLMAQKRVPDLIFRGHYHDRTIEHVFLPTDDGKLHETWGIVCPGYSLFTDDYTLKATASKDYMTVGTMPIEVVDGKIVRVHDRAHTISVVKEERMP